MLNGGWGDVTTASAHELRNALLEKLEAVDVESLASEPHSPCRPTSATYAYTFSGGALMNTFQVGPGLPLIRVMLSPLPRKAGRVGVGPTSAADRLPPPSMLTATQRGIAGEQLFAASVTVLGRRPGAVQAAGR